MIRHGADWQSSQTTPLPENAPNPQEPSLTPGFDARMDAIWRRLRLRMMTQAGNVVNEPVTLGATTMTVAFAREEPDVDYGVLITPNWDTTVSWANKTTTTVDVNFGTMAPANAFIDVITMRSED